jgi:predicted NBD/HSP70 family sugar kinase
MNLHASQLRTVGARRVFRALLAEGEASRPALARFTGLSAATVGKIVDELAARGLVVEGAAAAEGAPGRPPRTVRLGGARRLLAVELGARRTAVTLVGPDGEPAAAPRTFATPRSVTTWARRLADARGALGARPERVLLSVPGVLDPARGELVCSPNLPWTEGGTLLPAAAAAGGAPVHAVQEIQALALGHRASPEAPDSFVLVDFGTGVGGAVVTGGELLHGPRPLCGEIGHTGVQGNRRRCACGAVGCLETLVSREGLLRSFRAARRRTAAEWDELRARVAEHGVERWLLPSLDAAGAVLGGAVNLLGIEELVLTGHLPALHPDVGSVLAERAARHSLLGRFGKLGCAVAPRRRLRGLVAAAEADLLSAASSA